MTAPTKRVPRAPTPEMIRAGEQIDDEAPVMSIWAAMWAEAAPDADAGRVAELEWRIERARTFTTGDIGPNDTFGGYLRAIDLILRGDAAPGADAGRVAELKRQLDAKKSLAIAQLELRIERALKILTTPTMNLPGTTGGGFIGRAIAILRGGPE